MNKKKIDEVQCECEQVLMHYVGKLSVKPKFYCLLESFLYFIQQSHAHAAVSAYKNKVP